MKIKLLISGLFFIVGWAVANVFLPLPALGDYAPQLSPFYYSSNNQIAPRSNSDVMIISGATFTNATSTLFSSSYASSTSLYAGTAYIPSLGTAAGTFLAANANGKIIATSTPAGSGTVTSVTLASPNSTFTLGGTNPITTSGTINADLNLANPNTWTGLQSFGNASTTQLTVTGATYLATTGGKVGIGQASPTYSLDVSGLGHFTGLVDASYFNATSTTATSTFPYLSVTTNSNLGTVVGGTWQGAKISEAYGGTNQSSYVIGDILYASAANTLSKLATSTKGSLFMLSLSTGLPSYVATSSLGLLASSTIASLTSGYLPKWGGSAFSNSLVYDNGSNIGIGHASPSYKLHIGPGVGTWYTTSTPIAVLATTTNNTSVGLGLTVNESVNNPRAQFYVDDFNTKAGIMVSASANNPKLAFGSDSSDWLTILETGKVGIGTSTPYSKLSVWGSGTGTNRLFELTNNASTTLFAVAETGAINSTGSDLLTMLNNKSQAGALFFNGTTSAARIYHTINQDIGTSSFTLHYRLRAPSSNPVGYPDIGGFGASNSLISANGYEIFLNSSGSLYIYLYGPDWANYRKAIFNNFISTYGGRIVDLDFVRSTSASTMSLYINGVLQTANTDTYTGTDPTWAGYASTTYMIIGNTGTNPSNMWYDRIYNVTGFNRALSATDVAQLRERGIAAADEWGNLTGQTSGTLTVGKKYRITTYVAGDDFTGAGAASNTTGVEFTSTLATITTWTNGSTLNEIGVFIDSDLENADPAKSLVIRDRSANNFTGTITTATGITQIKPVVQLNISNLNNLLFASSSNIGIGTTSPSAKLSINSASTGVGLYIAGYANGIGNLFSVSTSTPSATSTAFVIDRNGKVGIGTSTPAVTLDINGYAKVLQTSTTTACSAAIQGSIFYNSANNNFWGCGSGSTWNKLGAGSVAGGGTGTVTSVATTYPLQGGTITSAGTLSVAYGTTTANIWEALNTFTNASSTLFSTTYASSTSLYVGNSYIPSLGTAAGSFLAVNANGQIIATTTPSGSSYTTFNNDFDVRLTATTTLPKLTTLTGLSITKSQISDLGTLFTQATASTTFQDRVDWTTHDNYPAACINQFIRQIGDTNTCASVATTDFASANISQWTNNSSYITQAQASTTFSGLTTGNTFSGLNTFTNASSTLFSSSYASTTQLMVSGNSAATSTMQGNFEQCNPDKTHCCYLVFGTSTTTQTCY